MCETLRTGQTVYVKRIGNASRMRAKETNITEETISTIGRKYFRLKNWDYERFNISSMVNDGHGYSPNFAVYRSLQEIKDEEEWENLRTIMRKFFEYTSGKLTLDQLRRISDIIQEGK